MGNHPVAAVEATARRLSREGHVPLKEKGTALILGESSNPPPPQTKRQILGGNGLRADTLPRLRSVLFCFINEFFFCVRFGLEVSMLLGGSGAHL